jgi:hypothetical protein
MTDKTTLHDIVELKEIRSYKNANDYLRAGWILLATHTWDYGHAVNLHQKTVYCLGWARQAGEPVHPDISDFEEKTFT